VRQTARELDVYVAELADQAERYGIALEPEAGDAVVIEIQPDLARRFSIVGFVPAGRHLVGARLEVSERWAPRGQAFERSAYRYELLDFETGYRRAFHRHDDDYFQDRFGVVVHEHCEAPIGESPCEHLFGSPVRDGRQAFALLMEIWSGDPPNCAALPCLEAL
jgi:hypothetical protein